MTITITISGPNGSGKTVLAGYIASGLMRKGVKVASMSSGARRRSRRPDQIAPALASLSQNGLEVVIKELPIKIEVPA